MTLKVFNLSTEGSLSSHSCCDTGLRFFGLFRETAQCSSFVRGVLSCYSYLDINRIKILGDSCFQVRTGDLFDDCKSIHRCSLRLCLFVYLLFRLYWDVVTKAGEGLHNLGLSSTSTNNANQRSIFSLKGVFQLLKLIARNNFYLDKLKDLLLISRVRGHGKHCFSSFEYAKVKLYTKIQGTICFICITESAVRIGSCINKIGRWQTCSFVTKHLLHGTNLRTPVRIYITSSLTLVILSLSSIY